MNKSQSAFLPFLFLSFLFNPFSLNADIIQLKNGNAIETSILKEDDEFMIVEAPGGKVKIPKNDIRTVWRGSKEELMEVRGKEVFFRKGLELYRQGRFLEASLSFEKARGPEEWNKLVYHNLAASYASAGEVKKAEASFTQALVGTPDNFETLLNAAHFYKTTGQWGKAIEVYQKAWNNRGDDKTVAQEIAYCHAVIGQYGRALEIYESLEPIHDIFVLNNKAAVLIKLDRHQKALEILQKIIQADPRFDKPFLNLAEISIKEKRYEDAEFQYKAVLALDPQNIGAKTGLARTALARGDNDAARRYLDEAILISPGDLSARLLRAQLAEKAMNYDDVIVQYEQALKYDPKNLPILDSLALVYLKKDDPQKALSTYKRLFSIDEKYAKGHANAGLVYVILNDADNAMREWNRALELAPDLREARQNKETLEKILKGDEISEKA